MYIHIAQKSNEAFLKWKCVSDFVMKVLVSDPKM